MHEFFVNNRTIILFAQGLVFFALGFAVWLQRRRTTRLRLTSSLIWLAAFAFVEALAIWGYVFVPIQEKYASEGFIQGLLVLRAVVQTAAFLFLVEFGLRLSNLSPARRRVASAIAIGVWGAILLGGAILADSRGWSLRQWEGSVEAAARYALLLPGAGLAAWGLWRQRDALSAEGLTKIRPYAAAAAAVLAVYAVFAGLIVEHLAPWRPGGVLNDDGFFDATSLPMAAFRGVLGLALCVLAVKLLEIFEVEAKQRLEALERARTLAEERARFGRDLHDGTIQSLCAAGMSLEAVVLRSEAAGVRDQVREVVVSLDEAITGLRGYITALRQPAVTPAELAAGLAELSERFAGETGLPVSFRAEGVAASGPLPDESGHHMEHILREALSNAARHAGPCTVRVTLCFQADEMDLEVRDDGTGLPFTVGSVTGQGLRNMRERARRLGGRLSVEPAEDGGTRVWLAVPLDSDSPAPDVQRLPSLSEVPTK